MAASLAFRSAGVANMLAAAAFLAAGAPLPAASSAPELAPPAAAFLELGRSVEGFAKLDPNAEDPSEAQSQTVDRTAMVTAWNRRYGDWYKKNNLKDCPNGYTVVQAPCFGNDGLTTVSCPYDRARPGENQKCVACVRRGQNGRCRVDTRFVPCG